MVAGMFSSPLNMVLREEKGWSYGAYGGFTESRDGGLFTARTSVQADKTAPALSEILKVLSTAAAAPPTDEMLAMTKDYLRKSLPGNFDTNANAAASLAALPTYELRNNAWSTYDHDIDVISSARSYSMASRWFRPERQLIVVVGPRTVQGVDVVAELKALGYEFVDASAQ
jgi:zinc protease